MQFQSGKYKGILAVDIPVYTKYPLILVLKLCYRLILLVCRCMIITTVNVVVKLMMKDGSVFSNAAPSIGMRTIANAFAVQNGKNAQHSKFMIQ